MHIFFKKINYFGDKQIKVTLKNSGRRNRCVRPERIDTCGCIKKKKMKTITVSSSVTSRPWLTLAANQRPPAAQSGNITISSTPRLMDFSEFSWSYQMGTRFACPVGECSCRWPRPRFSFVSTVPLPPPVLLSRKNRLHGRS